MLNMKKHVSILLLMSILIMSCSKDIPYNPNDKQDPIIIPDTINVDDTVVPPFVVTPDDSTVIVDDTLDHNYYDYNYEGNWRYTNLTIGENGIVHTDTTYKGDFLMELSTDSVKIETGFVLHTLGVNNLIENSLAYMSSNTNCRCSAQIQMSKDLKEVKFVFTQGSQGPGGPAVYEFAGILK